MHGLESLGGEQPLRMLEKSESYLKFDGLW